MMKGNDGPVAFEISLVFRNKVYLLRSEYVQNMKEYSPGTLLRLHALEWYFENGLSEYDMLGKFDESKKIWTDYFRKQEEVIIFNRTLKGKFIHTLQFVRENAKTLNLKK
jgi:CelD/BcsL family acetyltransferase involved in cellulose biosynthesis